ncbi:MAG: response regulator [Candidatus Thorarchaeota archaeon]
MPAIPVLFVDDESSLRNAIAGIFQFQHEYEVDLAASGKEALQMMREREYHIVVSDQRMPEMSGEEFLDLVREEFPDTIRMILTAYGTLDLAQKAMNELGVFGFLQKPIKTEELLDILYKAAERYKENRRIQQLRQQYKQVIPPSELLENLWIIHAMQEDQKSPEILASYPRALPGVDVHRIAVQTFLGSAAVAAVFGKGGHELQMTLPLHYLKMEARIHVSGLDPGSSVTPKNKPHKKHAIILLAPTVREKFSDVVSSCMSNFAQKYHGSQDTGLESLFNCISSKLIDTD